MNTLKIDNYIIKTPIIDILKDIKVALSNQKLNDIRKKGDSIMVTCPFHSEGQESHPSCGIYIGNKQEKYGHFNCFTCGKHGDFISFVCLCFNCSFIKAKQWLITHYGEQNTQLNSKLLEIVGAGELFQPKTEQKYLDESILDSFQSYHPYMDKRKLSKKVCEAFKIKYDPKSESLVFPVWDENGKLLMLTRRSVKNKRFLIDKDQEKPVYLMNAVRKRGLREVTVCESQINALTLWGWGVPAVATFGCNVTDRQMDVFNHSGLLHIYLAFDGDEAGRKGIKKFIKQLRPGILVDIFILPNGRDVNDLSEEEFNSLKIVDSQQWLKEN